MLLSGYFFTLVAAPQLPIPVQTPIEEVKAVDEGVFEKRLMIPKLQLDEEIYGGGVENLEKGIWHKFEDRSSPVKGGNFVLVGHRFNFGLTPGEVKRTSPLYNIDKLKAGDEIIILWGVDTYRYVVTQKKTVPPTAIEEEANTSQSILTLYTCTLGGKNAGRIVIHATPF